MYFKATFPIAVCAWLLCSCGSSGPGSRAATRAEAIHQAHVLYQKARSRGLDFSEGPCLSNGADIPGWVVDIAHNPRQAVDDLPRNQCSAYVNGRVDRFVELDPKGRLIRTGP